MATEKLKFKIELYATMWDKPPVAEIIVDGKSHFKGDITSTEDKPTLIEFEAELEEDKNIDLIISEKAKSWIAKNSFDEEYGARPLKRTIESNIKDKLADQLLLGKLKEGYLAFVDEENDSISLKIRDSEKTIH